MQNICCGKGDLEEIRRRYSAEDPNFVQFCEMTVAYFGERLSKLEQQGRVGPGVGQWTFERLTHQGREVELAEPLTVRIHRNGKRWRAEHRDLGICVFASSIERLLERVAEAFFALWDRYIPVDDEVMEKDAAIRDALLRMVTGQQKTF